MMYTITHIQECSACGPDYQSARILRNAVLNFYILDSLASSYFGSMIQTGLLASTHADLVTDSAFDYYGLRLATTSLDQRSVQILQHACSFLTWSGRTG